jgi:cbb3-type cytochrome oxidase subunit 3
MIALVFWRTVTLEGAKATRSLTPVLLTFSLPALSLLGVNMRAEWPMMVGRALLLGYSAVGLLRTSRANAIELPAPVGSANSAVSRVARLFMERAFAAERLSITMAFVMLALAICGAGGSVGLSLYAQRDRVRLYADASAILSHFATAAAQIDDGYEGLVLRHRNLLDWLKQNDTDFLCSKEVRKKQSQSCKIVDDAFSDLLAAIKAADAASPAAPRRYEELYERNRDLLEAVSVFASKVSPLKDLDGFAWSPRVGGQQLLDDAFKVNRSPDAAVAPSAGEKLVPDHVVTLTHLADKMSSIAHSLGEAEAKAQLAWSEMLSRLAIAALTLFLIQIFFSMYRYARRGSDSLAERAAALELVADQLERAPPEAKGKLIDELVSLLRFEPALFGAEPKTPLGEAVKLAEAVGKIGAAGISKASD